MIKCEGIIKAIFENPKADQNTLFDNMKFLNHLDCTFSHGIYFQPLYILVANGYIG